jgi:hypothetical protein
MKLISQQHLVVLSEMTGDAQDPQEGQEDAQWSVLTAVVTAFMSPLHVVSDCT